MITFVDNEAGKSSKILLQGEINIYCSDEIQRIFINKLNDYEVIYLDHEKMSETDLSYLQILFSAIRTSVKANKKIFIDSKSADKLKTYLAAAGFASNSEAEKLINTAIKTETEN
ncbi:MAG TPA: hypothetical protein VHO28_00800 [Ignavibacteriales bacterium]|nr:hypothetical protein [Ignavibacteriales bacterium]